MTNYRADFAQIVVIAIIVVYFPLVLILTVLGLAYLGVLPGKPTPMSLPIILGMTVFLTSMLYYNLGMKVRIRKSKKVTIPNTLFVQKLSNEYMIHTNSNSANHPIFVFTMDNIKQVYICKEVPSDGIKSYHSVNPNKTICIKFKQPLSRYESNSGVQAQDDLIDKIYVSVGNPRKLVRDLAMRRT
jgi:hypothetical protein